MGPLKVAFFAFDDGEWLPGWTLGQKWNGWGCPYFDAEQLPAVLQEFERFDYSVEQRADGTVVLQHADDEIPATITPSPSPVDGRQLWSFGFGYTWNEREEKKPTREEDFLVALDAFVGAAFKLEELWPEDGLADEGYPECLPSFDDFAFEVMDWRDGVRERADARKRSRALAEEAGRDS